MDNPALKFFFRADKTANTLLVGYPVFIKDTTVGTGVISVDTHNSSIVGIGTTFLDNIYKVHAVTSPLVKMVKLLVIFKNGQTLVYCRIDR